MNKYQEALRILVQPYHSIKSKIKAEGKILELVEKATPKKPDKYVLLERDYLGFPTQGYCKTCGTSLLVKNDYCGRCGQAIDWSKNDE